MDDQIFYAKVIDHRPIWSNNRLLEMYLEQFENKLVWAKFGRVTGIRTAPQNAALHVYYAQLAKALNEKHITMQEVLSKMVEIEANPRIVKEAIWRPIQIAITGKQSTTQLDKVSEIDETYEHINRFTSMNWGIAIPFPSEKT